MLDAIGWISHPGAQTVIESISQAFELTAFDLIPGRYRVCCCKCQAHLGGFPDPPPPPPPVLSRRTVPRVVTDWPLVPGCGIVRDTYSRIAFSQSVSLLRPVNRGGNFGRLMLPRRIKTLTSYQTTTTLESFAIFGYSIRSGSAPVLTMPRRMGHCC